MQYPIGNYHYIYGILDILSIQKIPFIETNS